MNMNFIDCFKTATGGCMIGGSTSHQFQLGASLSGQDVHTKKNGGRGPVARPLPKNLQKKAKLRFRSSERAQPPQLTQL